MAPGRPDGGEIEVRGAPRVGISSPVRVLTDRLERSLRRDLLPIPPGRHVLLEIMGMGAEHRGEEAGMNTAREVRDEAVEDDHIVRGLD
jgi:hypothetical protein